MRLRRDHVAGVTTVSDGCADGEPKCDNTSVNDVTCNVTVHASNIHKALESLEVRPVIDPHHCVSETVRKESAHHFVVVANVTNTTDDRCSSLNITLHAYQLTGKLVSTIDNQPPLYRYNIPLRQGTINAYRSLLISTPCPEKTAPKHVKITL